MAGNAGGIDRLETWLTSLELMLADMPKAVAGWARMNEAERASWMIDWAQLMTVDLPQLKQAARVAGGEFAQRERYQRLMQQLRAVLPVVWKLHLMQPDLAELDPGSEAVRRTGDALGRGHYYEKG